jgi:hypothetical protein
MLDSVLQSLDCVDNHPHSFFFISAALHKLSSFSAIRPPGSIINADSRRTAPLAMCRSRQSRNDIRAVKRIVLFRTATFICYGTPPEVLAFVLSVTLRMRSNSSYTLKERFCRFFCLQRTRSRRGKASYNVLSLLKNLFKFWNPFPKQKENTEAMRNISPPRKFLHHSREHHTRVVKRELL